MGKKLDGDRCFYCDFYFEFESTKTKDHVVPLSNGGKGLLNNTVLCCRDCNTDKANLTLQEFIWKCLNDIDFIKLYTPYNEYRINRKRRIIEKCEMLIQKK